MKFFDKKQIYLDYVSSTPTDERVVKAMKSYWSDEFGNPSAKHIYGRNAKKALEDSRSKIAKILNARAEEIIFTSGGTESNNLAISGIINYVKEKTGTLVGYYAITSEIEHPSVLNLFKHLENKGLKVNYIKADENGIVNVDEIKSALNEKTLLVSIMFVNNEIGTIQPVNEISKIIRSFKNAKNESAIFSDDNFPYFHTDASQAPLFLDLNVKKLGVDLLTIDGQKIYGPKGIGALFIKKGVPLRPLFYGGGQEMGLRAGTENIPLIVGLAESMALVEKERNVFVNKMKKLQDYFVGRILSEIPGSKLNGDKEKRTPNNANISFDNIDHEFLAVQLDENGIFCSTKSACMADKEDDSYIISAINRGKKRTGAIRFSLGKETTKRNLDYVLKILIELVNKQRKII